MKEYKTVFDEYKKICKEITKLIEHVHTLKKCRNNAFISYNTNPYQYKDENLIRLEKKRARHLFYLSNKELKETNQKIQKLGDITKMYKQKLKKLSM